MFGTKFTDVKSVTVLCLHELMFCVANSHFSKIIKGIFVLNVKINNKDNDNKY